MTNCGCVFTIAVKVSGTKGFGNANGPLGLCGWSLSQQSKMVQNKAERLGVCGFRPFFRRAPLTYVRQEGTVVTGYFG